MARRIQKAAVLGAGVMGAGIAAHLTNAGIPTVLLDIVPPNLTDEEKQIKELRNKFALNGIEVAKKFKPAPLFFHGRLASLITPGNLEDDLELLSECDIIIEAVVENLDIKRALFQKIEPLMKWGAIVSSNTSGLSIASMTEGFGPMFKQNFLVTHFFNPVRFMKLLELVAGPETDQEVIDTWVDFGTNVLGKGIVFGKDTPNFVANRIGVYAINKTIQLMIEGDYTIEEVDVVFGKPMAHPRSAAFKTADLVGVDTYKHVSANCYDNLPEDDERDVFTLPDFVHKMVENKWLGGKTKGGFYKKDVDAAGKRVSLYLDWKTMEYVPTTRPNFDSVKATKGVNDPGERVATLLNGEDRGQELAWKSLAATLAYTAKRIGEIADDVVNIDNAMKWGFNWELGPFEVWDAIGVADSVAKMKEMGLTVPALVDEMLEQSEGTFYKREGGVKYYWDFASKSYIQVDKPESFIFLPDIKEVGGVVKENFGATLYDLGDGIAGLEFHTKMNSLDEDIITMLHESIDEVEQNWNGLVIGGHAEHFSAGANIAMVLMAAQMENWEMLGEVVDQLQQGAMRMKYCRKPVVTAPYGMAIGGGCEVGIHGTRIQAHAELYMGLVEVGVGVLPAGGGCKESVCRMLAGIPGDMKGVSRMPMLQKAFENIATAKVSKSAEEARSLGYLRPMDNITLNRDRLIYDAKQTALGLYRAGYNAPLPPDYLVMPGTDGAALFLAGLEQFAAGGFATPHDVVCGKQIAKVLTGGDVRPGTVVTEQHLLDLEKEGFLYLCGTKATQDRIEHMLATGKPLRN